MTIVGNKCTSVVGNLSFSQSLNHTNINETYRRCPCSDTGARAAPGGAGRGLDGGDTGGSWWLGNGRSRGVARGLTHVATDVVEFAVGELNVVGGLVEAAKTAGSGLDERISTGLVRRELGEIRSQFFNLCAYVFTSQNIAPARPFEFKYCVLSLMMLGVSYETSSFLEPS